MAEPVTCGNSWARGWIRGRAAAAAAAYARTAAAYTTATATAIPDLSSICDIYQSL